MTTGVCIIGIVTVFLIALVIALANICPKTPDEEQLKCIRKDMEEAAARKREREEKRRRRRAKWQS